jgi:hypothetical protein
MQPDFESDLGRIAYCNEVREVRPWSYMQMKGAGPLARRASFGLDSAVCKHRTRSSVCTSRQYLG